MKSLLIFNHYALAPGEPGGSRHFDLARGLVEQGVLVTIVASSYCHFTHSDRIQDGRTYQVEEYAGVRYIWIATHPRYKGNGLKRLLNMVWYAINSVRICKQLHVPADAVLGSSVHPFAWLSAYNYSRRIGAAFNIEIRDLWPQTLVDLGRMQRHSPLVMLFGWIERFACQRAQAVVHLLPGVDRYFDERGYEKEKLVYIPNGINRASVDNRHRIDDLPEPYRTVLHRLENRFICLYTGSIGLANDLDTVLRAAGAIQEQGVADICFLLVGDGPEKVRLESYVRKNGLDNVLFLPPIAKNHVYTLIERADVCVASALKSGLYRYGISFNKIFDYMGMAKPIIMACEAYRNPVAEAGAGFIVDAEDHEALAHVIVDAYHMDRGELKKLGESGRLFVWEQHEVHVLSRRLYVTVFGADEQTETNSGASNGDMSI